MFTDSPCTFHHLNKVIIWRKWDWKICVVIIPFSLTNLPIIISFCPVKCVQELINDLFFSLSSLNEVFMARDIVHFWNILEVNCSIATYIHDIKGFFNHCCSSWSEIISKSSEEFLVVDIAVTIYIIVFEKCLKLDFLWEKTKVGKRLLKLSWIKFSISVVIELSESVFKASQSDSSFCLDVHFELKIQFLNLDV